MRKMQRTPCQGRLERVGASESCTLRMLCSVMGSDQVVHAAPILVLCALVMLNDLYSLTNVPILRGG